jgi:hypothetical protein
MATLTTTTGFQYFFQPANVVAISDRNPLTQQATTCVYGLSAGGGTGGLLPITGSVQDLMSQLKGADKFGEVTGPDGTNYWFNVSLITSVSNAVGDSHAGANSVVFAGGQNFFITEPLASAASLLGQAPSTSSTARNKRLRTQATSSKKKRGRK